MGQSPILAAVDLSPVQPQSCSLQDLSQDYRPASVSSRLLSFIQRLGTHFAMKDLGDLHFFLGIEAKRTSIALVLTQTKYTLDLHTRTHMQDFKPCPTPLPCDWLKALSIRWYYSFRCNRISWHCCCPSVRHSHRTLHMLCRQTSLSVHACSHHRTSTGCKTHFKLSNPLLKKEILWCTRALD